MSSGFTAGVLTLFVPIFLFAASCASSGDDKTEKETQKRYSSPKAVFDAYRESRGKHEWRKVFSLLTTEAQDDAVFETFFACAEHNSKEDRELLKKYGVDEATLTESLKNEYKAKYGVYPDDAALNEFLDKKYGGGAVKSGTAQSDTKSESAPVATKRDVMSKILSAHIKDKAGFYESVAKHFDERDAKRHEESPISPLGELEDVIVHDDTATGRAATSGFHYETPPGKAPRKIEDKIYKPFKFRRGNGGWLLDSL